jgi:hypothetical protein
LSIEEMLRRRSLAYSGSVSANSLSDMECKFLRGE